MRKIKITENQYKLIENFLFEAKNRTFDRQLQQKKVVQPKTNDSVDEPESSSTNQSSDSTDNNNQEKLNDLNNKFNDISIDDTFIIRTSNSSFKGIVSRKTDTYIDFDILLNNGKSLLDLKTKNNPPFTLESNQIVFGFVDKQGKSQKISGVVNMNISKSQNPSPDEGDSLDEPETNPESNPTNQPHEPIDDNDSQEKFINSHNIYRTILDDPALKDAFWKQPKLFNMIKLGDPVGVGPATELINKYKMNKFRHRNNQIVEFKVIEGFNNILSTDIIYTSTAKIVNNVEYLFLVANSKRYKMRIISFASDNLINAELTDRNNNLNINERGIIKYI